jgi:DNA-binding CsgD family transcriptional regulator
MLDMQLTSRQKAIYRLIGAGLDNKTIAGQLFIEEHCVKYHITNILKKAKLRSRTALCALFAAERMATAHNSAAHKLLTSQEAFQQMIDAEYAKKEKALSVQFNGHRSKAEVMSAWKVVCSEARLHPDSAIAKQMAEVLVRELKWNG